MFYFGLQFSGKRLAFQAWNFLKYLSELFLKSKLIRFNIIFQFSLQTIEVERFFTNDLLKFFPVAVDGERSVGYSF